MKWFFVFILVLATAWWLIDNIAANPGETNIIWGQWSVEMQTGTLLLAVLFACVLFYVGVRTLLAVLGLRQRLLLAQDQRLRMKASQHLTQGLIQLAEGHWDKAETLLTAEVQYSETPLLNYLTAARAAHMQGKSVQRDEMLRQAIASDNSAQVAVGVSRAEMQLSDAQLEQAYATLYSLRSLAPQNQYVLKLYAKTLFRQKNWQQLLALLPELQRHDLLESDSYTMRRLKAATLSGIFDQYAHQQQVDKLQTVWEQLPIEISTQPESQRLYANTLQRAGADEACAAFIVRSSHVGEQDEKLTDLYGRLLHDHGLPEAIEQAQLWLSAQPHNPVNLLLMARLYKRQQDYTQAKQYYADSLNQSPDASAYLELAEMLEAMGEYEQAARCYRVGLRYSIRGQGERLTRDVATQPPLQVAG